MSKPIANEIEYLRYFFDQVNVSPEEHILIAEAFEMYSGKRVPIQLIRSTDPSPSPQTYAEELIIPKAPYMPSISEFCLDKGDEGDYVLKHKKSGEYVSIFSILNELKDKKYGQG